MKNRFYGYNDLKGFEEGILSLREALDELTTQDVPPEEVLEYDIILLKARPPYRKGFWAYDNPNNMPADCRVAYVYTPTYLATAILMYSWMKYQRVREFLPLGKLLKDAMFASTGRNFLGSGLDSDDGLIDAVRIFEKANASEFIAKYPRFCPEFTAQYRLALEYYNELMHKRGGTIIHTVSESKK